MRVLKTTIIILGVLLVLNTFLSSRTPAIRDGDGGVISESISEIVEVRLGGINQTIMIRGENKSNPVLLFLHGGPGYPQISYARKFQNKLEESFVVVNWDQRGSGKSYSPLIPDESMTKKQLLTDSNDLIDYLRNRFDADKIYLVGHSWGSNLGVFLAQSYPEKLYAYIGIGQSVNDEKGENISYEFTLREAKIRGNLTAIEELEVLGSPPYEDPNKDIMIQRKWLGEFGGAERKVNTLKEIMVGSLISAEYSWIDGIKFIVGNYYVRSTMWEDQLALNLFEEVPELKVPVYFCIGRFDYNTPFELVEQYYNQLKAPKKEFIWFEDSAHAPHFEEPNKFAEILLKIRQETSTDVHLLYNRKRS